MGRRSRQASAARFPLRKFPFQRSAHLGALPVPSCRVLRRPPLRRFPVPPFLKPHRFEFLGKRPDPVQSGLALSQLGLDVYPEISHFGQPPVTERLPNVGEGFGKQIPRPGSHEFDIHGQRRLFRQCEPPPCREISQRRQNILRISWFQVQGRPLERQRQISLDPVWDVRQMDERLVAPGFGPGSRPRGSH
jgi:hypothetical protein